MSNIKAILFDLDGTLANTAPDMSDALNILLNKHGKPHVDYESARKQTSRGSLGLIQLGFGPSLEEAHREELKKEYLQIYANNLCHKTELFDGITEVLNMLDDNSIAWGIVTNKPGFLTEPLLKELGITQRTSCIVCGDTLTTRKPHPDPLHHAAAELNVNEKDTIYLGDDPRDIQAGQAAGMKTAVAAYGYIPDDQDIHAWGADLIVQQPSNIKDWIFTSS